MDSDQRLRDALVAQLTQTKSYNLPALCVELGLADGIPDDAFRSKRLYVEARISQHSRADLEDLAVRALALRPDFFLNEALLLSRQAARPTITELSRRKILDALSLRGNLSGRLELTEFLKRIWPLSQMPSTDGRFRNAEGDIWQHMVNNNDWSWDVLYGTLGLLECSDKLFAAFCAELVHPVVRDGEDQVAVISMLDEFLDPDGYHLVPTNLLSGQPVYNVLSKAPGVGGRPKNLIFAAAGPKPEIVLIDAVNNDIAITRNADYCLVYDEPIPAIGVTWTQLIQWWINRGGQSEAATAERDLYRRLLRPMSSPPERAFFDRYFRVFRPILRERLPALIPQVYLHFDPLTLRQRGAPGPLPRQRMDLLLLLPSTNRVVIEIDGKQHYAIGDRASPDLYGSLVAADRDLRLSGYEVYRFGAGELQTSNGLTVVDSFFRRLFTRNGLG